MSNVYEKCPIVENDRFLLRFVEKGDVDDLLEVYSDKNALPFFNSDNCDGDNFYYHTKELMEKAMDFWFYSYKEKWFVRWAIIDKETGKAIGTIELFHRDPDGNFGHVGLLRLDLLSTYEREEKIKDILSVIVPPAYEMFDCEEILSKVPLYAIERIKAFSDYGFTKSDTLLMGKDGDRTYGDYWSIKKLLNNAEN